ncbi:MAG: RNA polymerase factor sigma-54 [Bacteroidia bacterium]
MLRQSLQQKLLQKLSPQQIQLMKLLQVPTMELEQRIKEEMEENPALEEGKDEDASSENEDEYDNEFDEGNDSRDDFDIDDYMSDDETPSYKLSVNNQGKDHEEKTMPYSGGKSFQEVLHNQIVLRVSNEKELIIADNIIGNLDESGYLRRELINIVDDLAFSQNISATEKEVEEVLKIVQDLEPYGVGARDLRECLIIQLKKKENLSISQKTALVVLEKCFEEFIKKHYNKIIAKLDIEEEDLKDALDEIVKLNPKPGGSGQESSKAIHDVIPDFVIIENDGELTLSMSGRNVPDLKVSADYNSMLQTYANSGKTKKDKEAVLFVRQKIDAAKWFIEAIKQRQQTLFLTMNAIMNYQKEYFLTGDETKLKPMILKDIADIVALDISTISRVVNSKYVQTSYGTFLLKSFFSESLSTDSGEEVSSREVKKILEDNIAEEDKRKPLTDEKLTDLLKEKGYNIARRTVAKYREQLNIPVARLRKEI